jgi:hypothetical protein
MRRVLGSVPGVTDFKRRWFDEHRFTFTYGGRACVVWEPWGDNSRYWIGPAEMEPPVDMGPINDAFRKFRFLMTFDRSFRGERSRR